MFGNAPRSVWEKWCPPDSSSRIDLNCRALLVQFHPLQSAQDHPLVDAVLAPLGLSSTGSNQSPLVLFETGIGAFFAPELAERYGVQNPDTHMLLKNLESAGFSENDITHVVLSHLHFDHAGGLLPAFPHSFDRLLFPNAQYVISREAWERACHPHPRDKASFIPEIIELLEKSQRLLIIESPEEYSMFQGQLEFFVSEGHTPGQLHSRVKGTKAEIVFAGDLVPGVFWIHHPITMGYDRFPEKLIDEKLELYKSLEKENTFLFFTHDTRVAMARVGKDQKGKFTAIDLRESIVGLEI